MTQFEIEIVSDTVCPWCYVGKKKLEQAIAEYQQRHPSSDDTFATTWKAFYLNPDSPKTGQYRPLKTTQPAATTTTTRPLLVCRARDGGGPRASKDRQSVS